MVPGPEQIVRCGGDTDTIASIYGKIYGASQGEHLPFDIIQKIDAFEMVQNAASELAQVASAN